MTGNLKYKEIGIKQKVEDGKLGSLDKSHRKYGQETISNVKCAQEPGGKTSVEQPHSLKGHSNDLTLGTFVQADDRPPPPILRNSSLYFRS